MSSASPSHYRHIADLIDSGRPEEARALLQRIISKTPGERNACVLMRHALKRLAHHDQALYYAEKALKHDPRDPDLISLVAGSRFDLGKSDLAERGFRAALDIKPTHHASLIGLANLLGLRGDLVEAAALSRNALERAPNDRSALGLYCSSLIHLGRADDAVTTLKHAMLRDPTSVWLLSLLCSALNYAADATPEDVLQAHKLFGRLVVKQIPTAGLKRAAAPTRADEPDRPLRLAIISADFREHPIVSYLEPLLQHFDRDRLSVHLYHNASREDAVSTRLMAYPKVRWTNIAAMTPPEIAARLRDDRTDIALDMSGHTAGNSLLALHFRPAPVQAAWVGYASTTGLEAMNYRIVDSLSDPDSFDALSTEKLWRLDPAFYSYAPPVPQSELPEPSAPPELSAHRLTFASFSSMPKINHRVISTWARVLSGVPNSALLIRNKGLAGEDARKHLYQRFADAGVSKERLLIEGPTPNAAHTLREYSRVDIALDTFPFQGMTTLAEAVTMGVPPVVLAGATSAGRQGISLMHAAGIADLVATSEDQYVEVAMALAADRSRRESLRRSLRSALMSSPIGDHAGFARRFETALRQMHRAATAHA